ncbi:GNAT family N-acetyltransferase [Kiloniella sp. EL199]|uniref:lipid II:glycine glycyltransferase FemX n=1 Tax=Kiloniella sp. EL199 TaxID=2107581 RepID=UPI000EA2F4C3|nr:GNAT family N-acetyltransferase [Kiloniella sp. EL199]
MPDKARKKPSDTPSPNIPPLDIKWNDVSVRQWRDLVRKAGQSNLLQSWPYAQAVLLTERLVGKFATIYWQGRIVGICQVLEQKLLGVFHKVRLYRGPLWLEPDIPQEVHEFFWAEIKKCYPSRPWRFRYFLPEMPDTEANRALLAKFGLNRIQTEGYSSIWLDLTQPEETLRANLKQNWRNTLNQSEKKGLSQELDTEGKHLNWLLKLSEMDKILKEFKGPSPALVAHLKRFTKDRGDFLLMRALLDGEAVGAILLFLHEGSATYLVGWNSQEGRDARAHNYLLWHALLELKKRDIKWLDLGGINPDDAKGVTFFKKGLGGTPFTLIGSYN